MFSGFQATSGAQDSGMIIEDGMKRDMERGVGSEASLSGGQVAARWSLGELHDIAFSGRGVNTFGGPTPAIVHRHGYY